MSDDELIALVRHDVEAHGNAMPPAPADAVAELEAAVGFPMPQLMKRIYLEVSDGGFGYWHGALSLTDDSYRFSDGDRMVEEYLEWQSAPDRYQPHSVVPLLTWGCAMWLHVDFSTPEARTWGWDPNMYCDRHRFYPEPFTLAEYLVDWLGDNELREWRPERDRECKDC